MSGSWEAGGGAGAGAGGGGVAGGAGDDGDDWGRGGAEERKDGGGGGGGGGSLVRGGDSLPSQAGGAGSDSARQLEGASGRRPLDDDFLGLPSPSSAPGAGDGATPVASCLSRSLSGMFDSGGTEAETERRRRRWGAHRAIDAELVVEFNTTWRGDHMRFQETSSDGDALCHALAELVYGNDPRPLHVGRMMKVRERLSTWLAESVKKGNGGVPAWWSKLTGVPDDPSIGGDDPTAGDLAAGLYGEASGFAAHVRQRYTMCEPYLVQVAADCFGVRIEVFRGAGRKAPFVFVPTEPVSAAPQGWRLGLLSDGQWGLVVDGDLEEFDTSGDGGGDAVQAGSEEDYNRDFVEDCPWMSAREGTASDKVRGDLLVKKGWRDDVVDHLFRHSSAVLHTLGNPADYEHGGRPSTLVVGEVQSGKTTSMCALCASALDVGYEVVVLLSGRTKALWRQSQSRVSAAIPHDGNKVYWLTHASLTSKMTDKTALKNLEIEEALLARLRGTKFVAVVMKMKESAVQTFDALERHELLGRRCLIIDDECDVTSLPAHREALDSEPDRRVAYNTLPGQLDRLRVAIYGKGGVAAYVGYTATPQANLLANARSRFFLQRAWTLNLPATAKYVGLHDFFAAKSSSQLADQITSMFAPLEVADDLRLADYLEARSADGGEDAAAEDRALASQLREAVEEVEKELKSDTDEIVAPLPVQPISRRDWVGLLPLATGHGFGVASSGAWDMHPVEAEYIQSQIGCSRRADACQWLLDQTAYDADASAGAGEGPELFPAGEIPRSITAALMDYAITGGVRRWRASRPVPDVVSVTAEDCLALGLPVPVHEGRLLHAVAAAAGLTASHFDIRNGDNYKKVCAAQTTVSMEAGALISGLFLDAKRRSCAAQMVLGNEAGEMALNAFLRFFAPHLRLCCYAMDANGDIGCLGIVVGSTNPRTRKDCAVLMSSHAIAEEGGVAKQGWWFARQAGVDALASFLAGRVADSADDADDADDQADLISKSMAAWRKEPSTTMTRKDADAAGSNATGSKKLKYFPHAALFNLDSKKPTHTRAFHVLQAQVARLRRLFRNKQVAHLGAARPASADATRDPDLALLERRWLAFEKRIEKSRSSLGKPSWAEVLPEARHVVKTVQVRIVNSMSKKDARDAGVNVIASKDFYYDASRKTVPENVIVTGGFVLGRGLTIEGLTVSYYVRATGVDNADTSLQASRWFGHRPYGSDLVTVYMQKRQVMLFCVLAHHDRCIRAWLGQVAMRQRLLSFTPFTFDLNPLYDVDSQLFRPTMPSKSKQMLNVVSGQVRFLTPPLKGEACHSNLREFTALLNRIRDKRVDLEEGAACDLYLGVPGERVMEFLKSMQVSEAALDGIRAATDNGTLRNLVRRIEYAMRATHASDGAAGAGTGAGGGAGGAGRSGGATDGLLVNIGVRRHARASDERVSGSSCRAGLPEPLSNRHVQVRMRSKLTPTKINALATGGGSHDLLADVTLGRTLDYVPEEVRGYFHYESKKKKVSKSMATDAVGEDDEVRDNVDSKGNPWPIVNRGRRIEANAPLFIMFYVLDPLYHDSHRTFEPGDQYAGDNYLVCFEASVYATSLAYNASIAPHFEGTALEEDDAEGEDDSDADGASSDETGPFSPTPQGGTDWDDNTRQTVKANIVDALLKCFEYEKTMSNPFMVQVTEENELDVAEEGYLRHLKGKESRPVSIELIAQRLHDGAYENVEAFDFDVARLVANAKSFFESDHSTHLAADELYSQYQDAMGDLLPGVSLCVPDAVFPTESRARPATLRRSLRKQSVRDVRGRARSGPARRAKERGGKLVRAQLRDEADDASFVYRVICRRRPPATRARAGRPRARARADMVRSGDVRNRRKLRVRPPPTVT